MGLLGLLMGRFCNYILWIDGQTDRQTDRQRYARIQADKETDRRTNTKERAQAGKSIELELRMMQAKGSISGKIVGQIYLNASKFYSKTL